MAVLKIYQAGQSVDVASPRVPQTGALAIPVGLGGLSLPANTITVLTYP